MAELNGYIKLHRKMLNWEWYDDIYTKSVFLHILLKASFKDVSWRGVQISAGSLVSSYGKIAEELNISTQQARTAINHLKSTGEITTKSTNRYTLFTVVKWQEFQDNSTSNSTNNQTSNQQPNNKQATNNQQHRKNVKECEEGKELQQQSTLLSEEDFTLVFKTWGKCAITRLTERVMEELTALAEEYGPENVVDAIKTAAEQSKVNLAYIKGILRNRASGVDKPKKLNSEEEKTLFFKRMYEKALAEEEEEERRNAQNRND